MPQNIETVCIIDDDSIYINLITKILELKKISKSVLVFKNGKEALDYFQSLVDHGDANQIPGIILLDLNMPIMDGWEFLDQFAAINEKLPERTNLYVVSSSINLRDIDRAKSIDIVSDYITKPLNLDDFDKILN
ncbi:MAG: response regulator [Aquimarina sp.]|nr:response regulator [Aquimarina sp.]